MNKFAVIALIAAGLAVLGCEGTETDVKENTNQTMDATMTPKVKAALIANPIINDPNNVIDVETKDGTVSLLGHVVDQATKNEATKIAQRVLDESESKLKLVNDLEIVPAPKVETNGPGE